jgi:hypothetical protein
MFYHVIKIRAGSGPWTGVRGPWEGFSSLGSLAIVRSVVDGVDGLWRVRVLGSW